MIASTRHRISNIKFELIHFYYQIQFELKCYRNELYQEEYVTINEDSGELRTGKDLIDFEKIEEIHYTIVASDGELETLKNVS
jgi:hypothetical protein